VPDVPRVTLVGLIAGGYSGVPRYAAALTSALDEVSGEFPGLQLDLVTTREGAEAAGVRNLPTRTLGLHGSKVNAGPARIALEQLLSATHRSDLLHYFDIAGPLLAPWRRFTATVHGASVIRGAQAAKKHAYKRVFWPWVARRAKGLVAISEFAKDEAVDALGADPSRIHVILSGPGLMAVGGNGAGARPPADDFFLYVGALAEAKNLPFLVRAWDRSDVQQDLLIVGRPKLGYDALVDEVERSPRRDRIHVLTDASDAEIDGLYRHARALLLPSRYEGFGFTPLEAMTRGCPVVASDIPALREIASDAALLLSPDDEQSWSEALRRLSSEDAWRAELAERGRRHVERFSWNNTARELCRYFIELVPAARSG
jgi:glycosyltransferase involved in cell wall biosynthesis